MFFSAIETYRNNTPRSGSGSGRKRERKLSTASSTTSCNSSSNKRHKKSGKTSSVTSSAVSATDRDNIPSQNSSSEPKFEASKLVEQQRAEQPEMVKPEATHLLNLPGSSGLGSARNLMPPPDKKVENDSVLPENSAAGAAALLPQNNHYMADQDELQVDLRKIQLLSLRVSNNPNDYFWIRAGYI